MTTELNKQLTKEYINTLNKKIDESTGKYLSAKSNSFFTRQLDKTKKLINHLYFIQDGKRN